MIKLFLCGDVMTGRAIDQILPYSCHPAIHESYLKDARDYIALAERKNGAFDHPQSFSYIWGDALHAFSVAKPDLKIINLETSITMSDAWMPKGINYRMNPRNVPCLTEAGVDCCVLANNHVLDYGPLGLTETLDTLSEADLAFAGVGHDLSEAEAPALLEIPEKGRVLVFAFGMESSGVPKSWGAAQDQPGVALLEDLSDRTVRRIEELVREWKTRANDVAIVSIHWGDNWSFAIEQDEIGFVHKLIDWAGVDLVHAHSSHHPKAVEIYNGHAVFYGCGDFINDYEGIRGYEEYRPDLSLMYFATIDARDGTLAELQMCATQMKQFRVTYASLTDTRWLMDLMNREGRRFGSRFEITGEHELRLQTA